MQHKGTVLITGGAGFLGSHLADELLANGYRVRVLDSLIPQVHGPDGKRPEWLSPEVELVRGDVLDRQALERALRGVRAVYHFAALVGVGQSMYQLAEYTRVNCEGTAALLEALPGRDLERLVVASSMSIYGEGLYRGSGGEVSSVERDPAQLRQGRWEPRGPSGEILEPLPTPESKPADPSSVYALSKHYQERMVLSVAAAYAIPAVALRFFNVYGPRQALSNPYTGVLAIFASRFLNGRPPLIFEDGEQRRDFVSVHDVVRACRLALETPAASGRVLNVGSGASLTIREVATRMARALGVEHIAAQVTGRLRVGDVRHCFADIAKAREVLGFEPRVSLEQGLVELADWLQGQVAVDRVTEAASELAVRGLTL